jgi:hypothetical protein
VTSLTVVKADADTPMTTPSGSTYIAPKGWTVTTKRDFILLEDPNREVSLRFVERKENGTAPWPFRVAWEQVQPGFARTVKLTIHSKLQPFPAIPAPLTQLISGQASRPLPHGIESGKTPPNTIAPLIWAGRMDNPMRYLLRLALLVLAGPVFLGQLGVHRADAAESRKAQEKAAKKACASGDFRKGVEILAGLYVDSDDTMFIYNSARCYEQNHEWSSALDRFREYMRKTPKLLIPTGPK